MKIKVKRLVTMAAVSFCACIMTAGSYALVSAANDAATATVAPYDSEASTSPTASELPASSAWPTASALPSGMKNGGITIIKPKGKIKAGKSYKFKVRLIATDEEVNWSVNKDTYARISKSGKLTAIKPGTVYVTAASGKLTAKVKVKIQPKHVVAIDAGHQARGDSSTEPVGPGASTRKAKVAGGTSGVVTHVPEYKLTLAVAKKLKSELETRGYKVVMTRTKNDVNISNKQRAIKANKSADICIRLHADGIGNSSVTGASALYPSGANKYIAKLSPASKKLSECVLNSMCAKTKTKNRGLSARDDLTGTNWSTIPVTLIEMGFMTNPDEDRRMQDDSFQNKMAAGMAEGVDAYYGY